MMTLEQLREQHPEIVEAVRAASHYLPDYFTEHSVAHVTQVMHRTVDVLQTLGYDSSVIEQAKIAAYLHDVGNVISRDNHDKLGAAIVYNFLYNAGMSITDISPIVNAIGGHDAGDINSPIAAALILADKSDVRRSRVTVSDVTTFDIHNQVNYSVINSKLNINKGLQQITLEIKIDRTFSTKLDFYAIYFDRMLMCKAAAEYLGCEFNLDIEEIEVNE